MNQLKQIKLFVFIEPCTWLFYCFFQPGKFKRDYEIDGYFERVIPMLRLSFPIFILSYFISLITRIAIYYFSPSLAPCCFSSNMMFYSGYYLVGLLLTTAATTAIGLVFGILCGAIGGLSLGIAFGLAFSITMGISFGIVGGLAFITPTSLARNMILDMATGFSLGIAFGIVGGILSIIAKSISRGVNVGLGGLLVGGLATSIALAIAGSIIDGIRVGSTSGFASGLALTIAASIAFGIVWFTRRGFRINIVSYIVLSIIGCVALAATLYFSGGLRQGLTSGISGGIVGGISAGIVGGITLGSMLGLTPTMIIAGCISGFTVGFLAGGIEVGYALAIAFISSYIFGYYRLPLFLVSGISGLKANLNSRKNPLMVFTYLHSSSLYWDERIFLPLPYLKRTLLIAADLDVKKALEEIAFIVAERHQQISSARAVSLEIALRDLELRESMPEIASASQRLTEILPQEAGLIDPQWITPFARLNDASRDASRYCSPLGWQARRNALEDMIVNLKRVYPNTAFQDARLNKRLGRVVERWRIAAVQECEKLDSVPEIGGRIDNPYIPGPALELRNSLFVGRRDLVQQLEETLGKGSHRPTFFLNGERRMGKSSTLKQLPNLLGARYLPIMYDLQIRGISSSAAAFLGAISEEITKTMEIAGMQIKKLGYIELREASRENEAVGYYLFDEWFKEVERVLEVENRTILLLLDEFEKLEEAGHEGFLNLKLLLDWFRSVIQNHPRLALLFSGVRSLGEMGPSWAGYFVNVQTLKVGFLHPKEAFQLITRPIPNFPGEQIFSNEVVEEIMRVTGHHPFLIQAVCSALIDTLNSESRKQSVVDDVKIAVNHVLENWWDTYFRDLWIRTDQQQRTCLICLRNQDQGNLQSIVQTSSLDERVVRSSLQMLLKRDLVVCENNTYYIATPIFSDWVQLNN